MPTISSTTISTNSALLKGVSANPGAGGATSVPPGILALPSGTVLRGEITQIDGRGNAVLTTAKGEVSLQTDLAIKLGSEVALRLTTASEGIKARILTINGLSPKDFADQSNIPRGQQIHVDDVVQTGKQEGAPKPQATTTANQPAAASTAQTAAPAPTAINPGDLSSLRGVLLSRADNLGSILQQLPSSISLPIQRLEAGAIINVKLLQSTLQLPTGATTTNIQTPTPTAQTVQPNPVPTTTPNINLSNPLTGTPQPTAAATSTATSSATSQTTASTTNSANTAPIPNTTGTTPPVLSATANPATTLPTPSATPTATAATTSQSGTTTPPSTNTPTNPISTLASPTPSSSIVNTAPVPTNTTNTPAAATTTLTTANAAQSSPATGQTTANPSTTSPAVTNTASNTVNTAGTPTATPSPNTASPAATATAPAAPQATTATSSTAPASPTSTQATNTPATTSATAGPTPSSPNTGTTTPAAPTASTPSVSPVPTNIAPQLAQGQIPAQVIGHEQSGETVLKTALGTLKIAIPSTTGAPVQLPVGTQFTLQLQSIDIPQTLSQQVSAQISTAPAPLSELSSSWKSLQQTIEVLAQVQPALAAQVLDAVIPKPGAKMASTMLFFMSALKGGDVGKWLGDDALKLLEQTQRGSELIRKLTAEFSTLRQFFTESPSPNWQAAFVPVFDGQEWQQAHFFLKKEPENSEAAEAGGTRFIMEVELSKMGPMQFDGLIKKRGEKTNFDLIIRSQNTLSESDRQNIRDIYQGSSEITGLTGGISFQTVTPFPVLPMQEILSDAPDVMA